MQQEGSNEKEHAAAPKSDLPSKPVLEMALNIDKFKQEV